MSKVDEVRFGGPWLNWTPDEGWTLTEHPPRPIPGVDDTTYTCVGVDHATGVVTFSSAPRKGCK
jgi:hypothetical protein